MRRRIAVAASALATAGVLAGCGGGSTVTETVTTDQLPRTATTAPAPSTAATGTTEGAEGGLTGEDLPALAGVPGVGSGSDRDLDDAGEFVDALYQAGDPVKPQAEARLEAAGYADGVLRDQIGSDPSTGIALLRSYVVELRDEAAARGEVEDATDEVESASSAASRDLEVPEIPGARAMRLDVDQGGVQGAVAFVTFAVGPRLYGVQGVAGAGELPQDELLQAARDLYAEVSATP
ncbi:hypothetical protein [Miltoncostaea marina]|uniref:hypothetical protein n=1 Tax=Miltoncostaea marina TaxID=2843215 RepID=UPI001C3E4CF4|nr:hypothetical protein [Miltoncostaea marina]